MSSTPPDGEDDALAGPGDDTRIMQAPDEDRSEDATADAAVSSDIDSSAEATDKSFTTHMDDGDAD